MTTGSGIHWVTPPERLVENMEVYGERVMTAVYAVATHFGRMLMDSSRRDAPWSDRTGNARSGLFFAVDGLGLPPIIGEVNAEASSQFGDGEVLSGSQDEVVIALSHTVWYGKWLEIGNGGAYAIVMSTIQSNLPTLEKMLNEIFAG
ncbi:MAG: hypothetical protein AB1453_03850 [Chloroflexota bacterium]